MISHEPDIRRKGLGFVRFKLHIFLKCLEPFILVSFGTFCCCALRFCARFRQLRMLAIMKFIGNLFLRQLLSIKVIGQARHWRRSLHCTTPVHNMYTYYMYI